MSIDSSESEVKVVIGPKEVFVEEYSDSPDSSPPSSVDDEDRVTKERAKEDIPPEYWHIQKLVKYLKTGNQTATVVSLCCMKDHDLTTEINQAAILEVGGLEILINLLEVEDLNCKLGSLEILKVLSQSVEIKRRITDLGGVSLLSENLCYPARDLQILVAETIHNVAQIHKARKHVRKTGGIPRLIDLMDVPENCLLTPMAELNADEKESVKIAMSGARGLWSVSRSIKSVKLMMESGAVPLLARLLRSIHMDVVIPTVGTLSNCSNDPDFQLAIQTEGMVSDVVKQLSTEFADLRRYAAETIFKCSENPITRDVVRQSGGLDPLVGMVKNPATKLDKPLLAAVTGAIWKTAISPENVERYDQLSTIHALVNLLQDVDESEQVLSNVVGALHECLKFEHNRETLRRAGGIPYLVNLLNYTYPPLLENVPMVLRESAKEDGSMRIIEDLDGVRLIWSLLKNPSPRVQTNAAWALVPCVKYSYDSGEMVRSFVGGLEIVVRLLESKNTEVLAAVCAAISEIAQDRENLGVISDHGVVPLLVNHVKTDSDTLKEYLGYAVAYCCSWGSNRKDFGRLGAITPLVGYMTSENPLVKRSAALALFHLSENYFNCVTMHESGVVNFLLKTVASTDKDLQEASAGCLTNIRKLALEAETVHLVKRKGVMDESDDDDED
ncbi:armadillo repeat-containing protein gudu [Agrilus planipennis]|uniref:Armadillo repeat-containing protein gudu n=1 Tax=Agrilus planipennis TaxID=224129 RepID=A0A1W4WL53_AGRPL|nr:armadillo repeat-containing protein gudu [Agrilus planipennis]